VAQLLDVRGLTVDYDGSRALHGIDFAVPDGHVVGVLGANGAGKSTLLNTIAGLVKPSGGAIFLHGERIDSTPANELARRGVCLIPEGRGILPALTVGENMRIALDRDERATDEVYERFPVLKERFAQPAGTLSGGEQQMLALARAFRKGAELLLVDEPSLGLAPRVVATIDETLRYLHSNRGRTIVWVEQYVKHVLAIADLVYILGRGRVAWAGEMFPPPEGPGPLRR